MFKPFFFSFFFSVVRRYSDLHCDDHVNHVNFDFFFPESFFWMKRVGSVRKKNKKKQKKTNKQTSKKLQITGWQNNILNEHCCTKAEAGKH